MTVPFAQAVSLELSSILPITVSPVKAALLAKETQRTAPAVLPASSSTVLCATDAVGTVSTAQVAQAALHAVRDSFLLQVASAEDVR